MNPLVIELAAAAVTKYVITKCKEKQEVWIVLDPELLGAIVEGMEEAVLELLS